MPKHTRATRLFPGESEAQAAALAELGMTNPFSEQRVQLERQLLGRSYAGDPRGWSLRSDLDVSANSEQLGPRSLELVAQARAALDRGLSPTPEEAAIYRELVLYALFFRFERPLYEAVLESTQANRTRVETPCFTDFAREATGWLDLPGAKAPTESELGHLFACMFQLRRAFHHIFHRILGVSRPSARLRVAVWESCFTHDMRAYIRSLHRHIGELPTLVTGPSGSGKELVARAVALSRYVPFDLRSRGFEAEFGMLFHALNVAALAPTLVESELFGHRRGAFTGALEDHAGWLETCPPCGVVFLDEIGDLEPAIQVKLLRLLESRTYQRLGETRTRRFLGKVVAATHRDIPAAMARGTFREDLYYRLCGDVVRTPGLSERLLDSEEELGLLVRFIAVKVAGEEEAPRLARETEQWVRTQLGREYPWPGNVRELEQCARNLLIRGEYRPAMPEIPTGADTIDALLLRDSMTIDQLTTRYCQAMHQATGSYVQTAERLGIDRRTVAKRVG